MYERQYKYISEHKEQYAAYARKNYRANKEKWVARNKHWRLQNAEYIRRTQRENKRKRKLWAIEYLGGKCKDCSAIFHPAVYEFHHRDPALKDRDPSKMLQLSLERLTIELDKCDLLCANCHRLKHHIWENQVDVAQ